MEKQIGSLTFKRVFHDDLQEGTRYFIEWNQFYTSTRTVATLVKHSKIITKWRDERIPDFPWTLKKSENFTLNFAVCDNKFYELIPYAQLSMEKHALSMILKQVDEYMV